MNIKIKYGGPIEDAPKVQEAIDRLPLGTLERDLIIAESPDIKTSTTVDVVIKPYNPTICGDSGGLGTVRIPEEATDCIYSKLEDKRRLEFKFKNTTYMFFVD